ncbi:Transcriptional effector CCR4-related protein [Phytophthora cinnamomi]|uniref:Transcriptional effector CCR4-related protein n=1 Tax=Phytophthora cinnamomi TaxID=4785 RepID=UPI003559A33D|nr:Transcriptional effector CCR4-related protein [Phytophthora cinnamomi]
MLVETLRRPAPASLSLMTFNLLAPCYFRHGGRVESEHEPAFLARAQAAIGAIKREQCDLVCLQEFWFNRAYQRAFRAAFQPTHYLHSAKRPGDKQDGLAVFVDKRKLELHYVESVDLVEDAGDRVALLLHVATKWNRARAPLAQRSFLVVNSHLTFPHNAMYAGLRLNQIDRVLSAVRKYIARQQLHDVPVLLCGDFNDYNDPVYRLVTKHGFASMFAQLHGREARITHCNHNNREVGVDFIFGARLQSAPAPADADKDEDDEHDDEEDVKPCVPRLQLKPADCHLVPRRLPDVVRLKRPQFGHDWRHVQPPVLLSDEEELVDYWRLVSDHRPLVARFDMLDGVGCSDKIAVPSLEDVSALTAEMKARLQHTTPLDAAADGLTP